MLLNLRDGTVGSSVLGKYIFKISLCIPSMVNLGRLKHYFSHLSATTRPPLDSRGQLEGLIKAGHNDKR